MSSLLSLTDQRNYHLYRKETDMRKGFNLLCGIVANELGRQVMGGHMNRKMKGASQEMMK